MRLPRPESTFGAVVELLAIVAFAVGLALLIQAFVVKPFVIPSGSMIPTLEPGQRVLVERVSYHFTDPDVGDIVVFHPPEGAKDRPVCGEPEGPGEPCRIAIDDEDEDENFIKRVIATPGDTLKIVDGHAIVNGERLEDDFTKPCQPAETRCTFPKEIEIPADHYFMMGDNRANSEDSRFWGSVPRDWIIGEAFATYWPPDRIGIF
jgi:signal peptidase I